MSQGKNTIWEKCKLEDNININTIWEKCKLEDNIKIGIL